MPCRGERLVERDDDEPRTRCRKCGAKLRAAPDGYEWDARERRYRVAPGLTEEEAGRTGWTCGRCGRWHDGSDMRA